MNPVVQLQQIPLQQLQQMARDNGHEDRMMRLRVQNDQLRFQIQELEQRQNENRRVNIVHRNLVNYSSSGG